MPVPKKVLENLGLIEKEAKVYLSCLELGPSPVQKIAQKAGINRTTAYSNLESLMKKGLVSTVKKGVKDYFTAESPEQLKSLIAKKEKGLKADKEELDTILPELNNIFEYAGERPVVRFYEGEDGLRAIEEDFIRTVKKGESGYSFVAQDELMKVFPKYESEYTKKRIKKNAKLKTIYTNKGGPIPNATNAKALREAVFVPTEKIPYKTSINIYGDKVAIFTLSGKIIAMIIENKEVAGTLREIFKITFDNLKKKK